MTYYVVLKLDTADRAEAVEIAGQLVNGECLPDPDYNLSLVAVRTWDPRPRCKR